MRHSAYTEDLFRQYRKHLGLLRYLMLREAQILVVPGRVQELLGYRSFFAPYTVADLLPLHPTVQGQRVAKGSYLTLRL